MCVLHRLDLLPSPRILSIRSRHVCKVYPPPPLTLNSTVTTISISHFNFEYIIIIELYVLGDIERKTYTGIIQTFKTLYTQTGVPSFFRGSVNQIHTSLSHVVSTFYIKLSLLIYYMIIWICV